MNNIITRGCYLVSCLLVFVACSSKRKMIHVDLEPKTQSELKHALQSQSRTYTWLSLKGKIKYKDDYESVRGTIHLRAKKDSIIWIRITKLGFEGARVRITPKMMEVINRIDKTYQKCSLSSIQNEFGIELSFQEIEHIILGDVIFPDLRYRSDVDSTGYILHAAKSDLDVRYHLRPIDLLIDQMLIAQYRNGEINATYEDYEKVEEIPIKFATKRYFQTSEKNGRKQEIELNITSVKMDNPVTISFNIPDHYEEVP